MPFPFFKPFLMRDYFFQKTNGKWVKIFFKELQYIEACDKYVRIVTEEQTHIAHECLYHFEKSLPEEFCRIHPFVHHISPPHK